MRLYLSSYNMGDKPEYLTNFVGRNKRTAIIANAWDASTPEKRASRLPEKHKVLKELGLNPEELDLRKYFNQSHELKAKLQEFGLLWILGGNSFVLLRAMNESGFSHLIKNLVSNSELVYGGYSAGACVATADLHGIELVDDPNVVPDGYPTATPWQGLGLVNFSVAPHYRSNHPESAATENVVKFFESKGITYKAISDGQVILVDGNKTEIVG